MDKFLDFKIKNHKALNKKILFVEYLEEEFSTDTETTRKIVEHYVEEIKKHPKLIVIIDIRNIKSFDKKSVWEGSGILKEYDHFFVEHITKAFLITESQTANTLINIILKVMKNSIPTILVKDIKEALGNLN